MNFLDGRYLIFIGIVIVAILIGVIILIVKELCKDLNK